MAVVIYPSTGGNNTIVYGTYAARPSAAAAGHGSSYYATDVMEAYVSTGAIWIVLPSGGCELGYAEISVADTTNSTAFVDAVGLSFSCMVGERPVILEFEGHLRNSTDKAVIIALIANGINLQNDKVFWMNTVNYQTGFCQARASGLTPGIVYNFKVQFRIDITAGGTAEIYGDVNWRSYLRVVST